MNEEIRALIAEAREVEARRVELTARALEQRVADLLPEPWWKIIEFGEELSVEITFTTTLTAADAEVFTERECRNTLAFIGALADSERYGFPPAGDDDE